MGFELSVYGGEDIPSDLRQRWPEMLAVHGIECEIYPDFSPEDWPGGLLPFKVTAMPMELIDGTLKSPAVSGFEVDFNGRYASFRTAMGRTATEFVLQCLCAAELAIATQGEYYDPQEGKIYQGAAAREAALAEIKTTLQFKGAASRTQYAFGGWNDDWREVSTND